MICVQVAAVKAGLLFTPQQLEEACGAKISEPLALALAVATLALDM